MKPTQRAAMQAALDALEDCRDGCEESHNTVSAVTALRAALAEPVVEPTAYMPGDWYQVNTVDEMQRFFMSRLAAIRTAAKAIGYAIGVHGSCRRDFDLIAVPWMEGAADADTLAHEIALAACGIQRHGSYDWESKPSGRVATSIPICWTAWHGMEGAGHIDLSVMTVPKPPPPPTAEVPLLTDDEIAAALPWAGFDDLVESYSARQLHAALRAIEQVVRQKAGLK